MKKLYFANDEEKEIIRNLHESVKKPDPIVTELQKNLNTKFSSGLVEDGYLGQKTRNAIYNALTKKTQQTITVPQLVTVGTGTPNDDN